MLRYVKIALIGVVSLQALLFAADNIVNIDACFGAVAYALSMADHAAYPASIGPSIESSVLIWVAVVVIVGMEITTGVVAGIGAWQLLGARSAPAAQFDAAKSTGILGCGLAMLVWFGLFLCIAGAYFQMWQTTAGALSLEGAMQYAGSSALIALFVAMPERA